MNMKKTTAFILTAATAVMILPATACKSSDGDKLNSYEITATYDGENTLEGAMTFTFFNDTESEISDLKFNLWGNAYREGAKYSPISEEAATKAYYDGISYGEMTVEEVTGCAGWETGGEDENILTVTLPESVYPDESARISLTYTLKLANVNHRTGVTQKTVNLGNFYPVLCAYDEQGYAESPYYSSGDPFVSECADYSVTFNLPKQFTAATSGKEVSRTVMGDTSTAKYELSCARDFAAVLSDSFKTRQVKADDCDITVYYTGEQPPENIAECAAESADYFSDTFGKYAYPTLSVVMTPLTVSGMEYPALVMIADDLSASDGSYTVVHETAHQWWYAMVGNDQVNCAWQDEGLAEYSTLCFFESHPSYGFTRTAMLGTATKAYRAYFSVYNQIFGKADTTMTRSLGDFASDYEYANIAYNKALIMFETLRTSMGDEKFFAALKKYFGENKFALAKSENLIAAFDSLYDVEGMIAGFVEGKTVI